MPYQSVVSSAFQSACKQWLEEQGEVLALFRYSYAAGARDYELFTSFTDLQDRIRQARPRTCVTVWGEPQLPLRGQVDEAFISHALNQLPDDTEWLLTGLDRVVCGNASWHRHTAGISRAELAEELPHFAGERVALGLHPAWAENGGIEVSAVVPEVDGTIVTGIY